MKTAFLTLALSLGMLNSHDETADHSHVVSRDDVVHDVDGQAQTASTAHFPYYSPEKAPQV